MLKDISKQVNLLTLPNRHDHWVPGPQGLQLHQSWTQPLLDLIIVAIYGSGAGYGRGGSQPETRAVLNMDALDHYTNMQAGIRELFDQAVGADSRGPSDEPKALLRRWLRIYSRQVTTGYLPVSQEQRQKRVYQRLEGWTTYIEGLLDPPKSVELLVECLDCEQRYAYNELGDRISALVAVIRSGEPGRVQCRSCGRSWDLNEYRALASA